MVYVWGVDQVSKNSEFLGVGEESRQCGKRRIERVPVRCWPGTGWEVWSPGLPNAALCFRTATFAIKDVTGTTGQTQKGSED